MANPLNPDPYFNPADLQGYNVGYIPNWSDLGQSITSLLGAYQGVPRSLPNAFHVNYGADPATAILSGDMMLPKLATSRSYVYGLDEEAFSRNLSTVIGKSLATAGIKLNDKQMRSVYKAAHILSVWGPQALGIAQQLLAQDSQTAGMANTIINILNQGISSMYGPGGSRLQMYSAYSSLAQDVPLSQRDALLMRMSNIAFPADNSDNLYYTAGMSNSTAASLLASAASMGNNILNVDTELTRELAQERLDSMTMDQITTDNPVIRRMAEVQSNRDFARLGEAGTLGTAMYKALRDSSYGGKLATEEERIAAGNQFTKFLDISDRLQAIEEFRGQTPTTFNQMIAMRSQVEELAKNTQDTKRKSQLNAIAKDITSIEKSVSKNVRDMNIDAVMKEAAAIRREELSSAVSDIGMYGGNSDQQTQFVKAMELRDQLTQYGVQNINLLAEDEYNDNGEKTGRQLWEASLDGLNEEAQGVVREYYSKYHDIYTRGRESLVNKYGEETVKWLQEYQKADASQKKQMAATKQGQGILNSLDAEEQATLIMKNQRSLLKPADIISTALTVNGTPIDEENIMSFINKITYGGLGTLSTERFNEVTSQIGAGMLLSGANGNDALQMAAKGAEAAAAVGGDIQAGAIYGAQAGLAAREAARTRRMDPSRAQEIAAQAAGRATKSLVYQAYNSIAAKVHGVNVEDLLAEGSKYGDLIKKIQRGDSLTSAELDTLYKESENIMSDLGMSSSEQITALNRKYSGRLADAAARNATAWMLNSTDLREVMTNNIQTNFANNNLFSEGDRASLSKIMVDAIGQASDMGVFTDADRLPELQRLLLKTIDKSDLSETEKENLTKIVNDKSNLLTLQNAEDQAIESGSNFSGTTDQNLLNAIQLSSSFQEKRVNAATLATIMGDMPDTAKKPWQNIVKALTAPNGSISGVIAALSTSVSGLSLNDEVTKDKLISGVALTSVFDNRYRGTTDLNPDETDQVFDTLQHMYSTVGHNKEDMALINKYMTGQKLTDEEQARIAEIEAKVKQENPELAEQITTAQENIKKGKEALEKKMKGQTEVNVSRSPGKPDSESVSSSTEEVNTDSSTSVLENSETSGKVTSNQNKKPTNAPKEEEAPGTTKEPVAGAGTPGSNVNAPIYAVIVNEKPIDTHIVS